MVVKEEEQQEAQAQGQIVERFKAYSWGNYGQCDFYQSSIHTKWKVSLVRNIDTNRRKTKEAIEKTQSETLRNIVNEV